MSTEYLLDTNVCIAIRQLLAGRQPRGTERQRRIEQLRTRWTAVEASRVAMSLVTLGELHFGVSKSADAHAAGLLLQQLRAEVPVLVPDEATAVRYGDIRAHLEATGQKIGPNDLWIAAHALAGGRTVVTNNTGEFTRVPGLTVEDWTA
jgi:tRNA(fMet)-specific endonuclease VapC